MDNSWTLTSVSADYNFISKLTFVYTRINGAGHGTSPYKNNVLRFDVTKSADDTLSQVGLFPSVKTEMNTTFELQFSHTEFEKLYSCKLQLYTKQIINGGTRTQLYTLKIAGMDGLMYNDCMNIIMQSAYSYARAAIDTGIAYRDNTDAYDTQWTNAYLWKGIRIARTATATKITVISAASYIKAAQAAIVELICQKLNRGEDYRELTWWQLQYAVLQKRNKKTDVEYVDTATAEAYLRENKPLLAAEYDALLAATDAVEGGDTAE